VPPEFPDIVGYAEYRFYLRDLYQAIKAKDKHFSHRYINAKCKARSSGWFGDILSGRLRLKSIHLVHIAAVFKLDKRTQEFLAALVDIERAEDSAERVAAMERWFALKGPRQEPVEADRFAFFEHWYHLAIREVINLISFDGDFSALGARLLPKISEAEAQNAYDLLRRLGMVLPRSRNHRATDFPVLVKAPDGEARQWSRIVRDLMRLAPLALDTLSKEERNFSALTLSLSPEGMRKAGDAISDLRKKLLIIADKDRGQNRVYQALFQVFPLTEVLEDKGD
jgi:uncharacterized protein (TIGR02147 family)